MKWRSGIEGLCWPYVYFFALATFNYVDYVFLNCCLSLYFEFCFWVFKGIGFSFFNYITYSTSFIIAFGNPLGSVFSECRRGDYFLINKFENVNLYYTRNDFPEFHS